MRFLTTQRISGKQAKTPEGFLLCSDVPIARTGEMIYGPDETPIPVGPDGVVHIMRDEADVFAAEFLASFNGKPVVNEHPPADVRPDNWRDYCAGTVLNPRRGDGAMSDYLMADLLVCDQEAIDAVLAGKRQVSCGYDAEYDETAPGVGRQRNLIANHVALVDAGRCGPRCAIGDRNTLTGAAAMKTNDKRHRNALTTWYDSLKARLLTAAKAKDEEAVAKLLEESEPPAQDEGDPAIAHMEPDGDEGDQHIHIHAGGGGAQDEMEPRMAALEAGHGEIRDALAGITEGMEALKKHVGLGDPQTSEQDEAIEGELAEEAPPGTADKARKAKDSAYLGDSYQATIAAAEILCPGIRVPTFDRAASPKATFDAICKLRRTALDLAYHKPDTRSIIDGISGGQRPDIDNMTCAAVRVLFNTASAAKREANNAAQRAAANDTAKGKQAVVSIAELNRRNKEYWAKQNQA